MGILVDPEGVLDARAAEPAGRLSLIEFRAEPHVADSVLLALVGAKLPVPIVVADAEQQRAGTAEAVNRLPLLAHAAILRRAGERGPAEERRAVVVHRAAVEASFVAEAEAGRSFLPPAHADSRHRP